MAKKPRRLEQAGELVGVRPRVGDLGELAAGRKVARDGQAQRLIGRVGPAQRHLDRQTMAVAGQEGALEGEAAGLAQRPHALLHAVTRLGREELVAGHGEQNLARGYPSDMQAASLAATKRPGPTVVGSSKAQTASPQASKSA